MTALCRCFSLLGLEVSLLVASILVGSCMLIFFLYVPFLLCSSPCNLPLLDPIYSADSPFFTVFHSFFSWPSVLFMHPSKNCSMSLDGYMMLSISSWHLVFLIVVWRIEHQQRFSSGWSSLLSSSLENFLSYPLVLIGSPTMLYPSLDSMMLVHVVAGVRVHGWSFHVFRLQLSCQSFKYISILWVFVMFSSLCAVLRHHRLHPHYC